MSLKTGFGPAHEKCLPKAKKAIIFALLWRQHFQGIPFEDDLDEDGLKAELGKIDIPFAPPAVFRASSFQSPSNFFQPPIPGNNSTGAMNYVKVFVAM